MKKFIALVLSVVLCVSLMVPAVALDLGGLLGGSEEGGELDIGTILNSEIVQNLLANEGIIDLTAIVLELVATMNQENLEAMGKEQVQNMINAIIDELGFQIGTLTGNKDLIFTYDPLKVMGHLFNFDADELTTKAPADEPEHPDEMEISVGDVDGDGRVTAADARLILRRAAQIIEFTMEQDALADVDKDGKVTAMDARIVLRVSAGMETLAA